MDLKEFILIIKNDFKVFGMTVVLVMAAIFAYFFLRPVSYTTSLMLDVAREGTQATNDYKYDNFYRIQADERFSETIVEWLASPAVESDIFSQVGIDTKTFSLKRLSKSFKAEKRSAQIVAVSFSAPSSEQAEKLSAAIPVVISKNIEKLNSEEERGEWFRIVSHKPVIVRDSFDVKIVFLAALALGVFLAFWLVLSIHYLK